MSDVLRSDEGTVITSHMPTNTQSGSVLDEVSGMRLRGQGDGARQEIRGTPSPPGHGFKSLCYP